MKKIYLTPSTEEIIVEMNSTILNASATGGGIEDDNSASTDNTPSDDPNSDFGW